MNIRKIEEYLQTILPEEEFNRQVKIAKGAKAIASLKGFGVKDTEEAYLTGLLSNSKKFITNFPFDLPLEVCQAIGILNYERDLILHNILNVLETDNLYAYIVRVAEKEVMANEMDKR